MANPYIYKEPLQGKDGFFNRRSELMRIASRVAADRPQSVSVVGEMKVGKTSLLHYLCDPQIMSDYLDDPASYICLFLALSQNTPDHPEAFFARMGAALEEQGELSMAASYDGFSDLVKQLMQNNRKLVLFCDDFGLVTQSSGYPLDFFSFMRSIANSNDVGYVTTSGIDLQRLSHSQDIEESPFFNIFTTVNLDPFKTKEARAMIEEPAQTAGVEFGDKTDWILELGGASPYLLQLTASLAFDAAQNGAVERQTLEQNAFREAEPYLKIFWEEIYTEAQQEVLRTVAAGKKVERRHEFAAELLEQRGHLSRNNDTYAFNAALVERFVKEHGSGGFFKRLFS